MKIFYWGNTPKNYGNGQTWVIAENAAQAREFAIAHFKAIAAENEAAKAEDRESTVSFMFSDDVEETIIMLNSVDPVEIDIKPGLVMVDGGYDG